MKKYSPILVVLLAVVFTSAACDLFDFLTNYDIRGSWDVTLSAEGDSLEALMVFSGTEETGTVIIDVTVGSHSCSHSGTYSVVQDKKVTITWATAEPCLEDGHIIMDGEFADEDTITGTAEFSEDPSITINWTAKRR